MKYLVIIALWFTLLEAKKSVDIESVIRAVYPDAAKIEKKSSLISNSELKKIEHLAQTKLKSKLIRYYVIHRSNGKREFAIVSIQKMRTKKAAILYMIENGVIRHVEILAFGEPQEFKPTKKWLEQFENKDIKSSLKVGDGIAAKSGATLSAKGVASGAKIALAIYEVKFRR